VGSHGRVCPPLPLLRCKPILGIDLGLEPRHEPASRRLRDLAPVVTGRTRQTANAGDLATDERI
jgi:hypothetical protein